MSPPNLMCEREAPVLREVPDATLAVDGGRLTGYAIVFGKKSKLVREHGDEFVEVIHKGAFDLSRNISFTYRHDDNAQYGDTRSGTLRLSEDDQGVRFELDLPPYATTIREKIASGVIRGMSFGFIPTDVYKDANGIRHIRKGELHHISPVYSPYYPQTSVSLAQDSAHKTRDYYTRRLKLAEMY